MNMSDQQSERVDIAVKARGFLRNRGTNLFSGRVVSPGGVYTSEQLAQIAECARRYGSGKIVFTTRLSAEVVGIPYENIDPACEFLYSCGLTFGGTGSKIRPITACKGTTCIFGGFDTQALAKRIYEEYYIGHSDTVLPHKFKIAVGGCPNSCIKPSLNDFGVEARRQGGKVAFAIYVGGTWGRKRRMEGLELSRTVSEEEIFPILDGVLLWYSANADGKERLAATIQRLGIEALEKALAL